MIWEIIYEDVKADWVENQRAVLFAARQRSQMKRKQIVTRPRAASQPFAPLDSENKIFILHLVWHFLAIHLPAPWQIGTSEGRWDGWGGGISANEGTKASNSLLQLKVTPLWRTFESSSSWRRQQNNRPDSWCHRVTMINLHHCIQGIMRALLFLWPVTMFEDVTFNVFGEPSISTFVSGSVPGFLSFLSVPFSSSTSRRLISLSLALKTWNYIQ